MPGTHRCSRNIHYFPHSPGSIRGAEPEPGEKCVQRFSPCAPRSWKPLPAGPGSPTGSPLAFQHICQLISFSPFLLPVRELEWDQQVLCRQAPSSKVSGTGIWGPRCWILTSGPDSLCVKAFGHYNAVGGALIEGRFPGPGRRFL